MYRKRKSITENMTSRWIWGVVLLLGFLPATTFSAHLSKSQRSELYSIFNKSDTAGLKRMLDQGLDINADMGGGISLLLKAANISTGEMVNFLIRHGADVDAKTGSGDNAIMQALSNSKNYQDIIPVLLKAGASVQVTNSRNGYNPIWKAASRIKRGYPKEPGFKIMVMLLKNGADPNAKFISKNKKFDGLTPLMHFSEKGFVHLVRLLLDFNADKYAKTGDGRLAIDFAKSKHHQDVVDLLAKWDPSQADSTGYNPDPEAPEKHFDPDVIYQKCKGDPREPWCYQEYVEKLGDPELCEPILKYWPTAKGVHGWCYYRLAVKNRDCSLCDAIKKQDIKKTCYRDACGRK